MGDEIKIGMRMVDVGEIMERIGNKRTTIAQHYGLKEEEYRQMMKDILCDFIQSDSISKVVDKHFKDVSAETRAKIIAFASASSKFEDIE